MQKEKGFSNILCIIVIIIIGFGLYLVFNNQDNSNLNTESDDSTNQTEHSDESVSKDEVSFQENGDDIILTVNGEEVQTLSVSTTTLADFAFDFENPNVHKFVYDLDVNFDGYNDVGVVTGIGYGGVNNFYDFYIYNPDTDMLEKSETLIQISNPEVDNDNQTVSSSYRDGPSWYKDTYKYTEGEFEKVESQE